MRIRLPKIARNFYILSGTFFLVWMLFIDSNDFISQLKLMNQVNELEARKEYYKENIEQLNLQFEERMNNPELLEKYAREEYFMKKNNEDLFIVVEEKEK